jgi:hypothetical protein
VGFKQVIGGVVLVCAGGSAAARGAAIDNVPAGELGAYSEVYRLAVPVSTPGWNLSTNLASAYAVNNAASIPQGSFTRVAYYLELTGATAANFNNGWVWVSFDAAGFTNRADRTGVPSTTSGEFYQQNVSNMTVLSNVPGIVTGTGIATGNVEFWPSNYSQGNTRAAGTGGPVPNASTTTYDFGDGGAGTTSGHGSMQIHNYDVDGAGAGTTGQTLLAYSAWGTARTSEMGIGTNPNTTQAPDYTVTTNLGTSGTWTTRTLQVFVTPEPAGAGILAVAGGGLLARRRRARSAVQPTSEN